MNMNLDSIHLRDAVLCVDCECITASVSGRCLMCAGSSLLSVSRVLGGVMEGQETARLLPMNVREMESVVRELVESAA